MNQLLPHQITQNRILFDDFSKVHQISEFALKNPFH